MPKRDRTGFTVGETAVATVILSFALLGLAASTGRTLSPVNDVETEFLALQAVEDRMSEIRVDPRYDRLEQLYAGTETELAALAGARRETRFVPDEGEGGEGGRAEPWTVVVEVSGGPLRSPVARTLVVAAP